MDRAEQIRRKQLREKRRRHRRKIILRRFFALLILFTIIGGTCIYIYAKSKLDKVQREDVDREKLNIVDLKLDDYYNILVFGVDSRVNDLRKNTRSDSMILVSINTRSKEVKLTSFYRDTYVNIDGHDYNKLGHAYAYGGATLALGTFNKNFDLDLDSYVTVNFTGIAHAVDLLGGVEVEITEEEVPYINEYGRDIAVINGVKYSKVEKSGLVTLSGYQAVGYARIRKLGHGDIQRASRQRVIVSAMLDKIKKTDIKTIDKLLDTMLPQILTNLDNKTILALAKDCRSYTITESAGFPYDYKGGYAKKAAVVFPVTLYDNVVKLHNNLFGDEKKEEYVPTDNVKNISEYIEKVRNKGKK